MCELISPATRTAATIRQGLQVGLGLGMDRRFVLETPLMWIDKRGLSRCRGKLGGSCSSNSSSRTRQLLLGNRERNEWGRLRRMPGCKLRKDGYARYRAAHAARRKRLERSGVRRFRPVQPMRSS